MFNMIRLVTREKEKESKLLSNIGKTKSLPFDITKGVKHISTYNILCTVVYRL